MAVDYRNGTIQKEVGMKLMRAVFVLAGLGILGTVAMGPGEATCSI